MKRVAISILKNFFLCNVFSVELEEVVQCNESLLQRFLHGTRRGRFLIKGIAILILKNFFLCNVFSMELEEVVFDVTNRFCNNFYMELEDAIFR